MMAAFQPAAALLLLWILAGNWRPGSWRRALLRAALLTGLYAVAMTEVLSLFHAVSQTTFLAGWLLLTTVAGAGLIRLNRTLGSLSLPQVSLPESLSGRLLLTAAVLIPAVTLLVALRTPPQTWDSLNYHLSRVAHWAQMGAVHPYATGIEVQNSMPPGGEMLVLQLYVLAGSDALVNLVGWAAVLLAAVGASLLAGELGAGERGQLFAALAALTLPMAIVQASTTMTDAVVALWLICAAVELLTYKRASGGENLIFLGFAAGLAILTKQTAYAFLLPLAVLTLIWLVRKDGWRQALLWGLVAVLLVGAINFGAFSRNQAVYGSPLGPTERLSQHANQNLTPGGWLSNLTRNLTLHLGTPSAYPNKALALGVIGLHNLLGLDINDPRTTAFGEYKVRLTSTHEDTAGNGLHLLLILAFCIALVARWKRWPKSVRALALTFVGGYFVFSLLFKWLMFGSRLQLPFFILFAGLLGWWLERWRAPAGALATVALVLASLPWLFSLDSRPILPIRGRSFVGSILNEDRETLMFANGLYLQDPLTEITAAIQQTGCTTVGIMLGGNSVEYPLWVLLDAQAQGVQVEWIVAGTPSAQLSDPAFAPCAVICEDCPKELDRIRGLTRVDQRSTLQLFLPSDDE